MSPKGIFPALPHRNTAGSPIKLDGRYHYTIAPGATGWTITANRLVSLSQTINALTFPEAMRLSRCFAGPGPVGFVEASAAG